MNVQIYVTIAIIALLIIWRRTRAMYRPIRGTGIRLLIPMIFMLPGILLMMNTKVDAQAWEWVAALAIGAMLSVPLIWTTNYEIRQDGQIYATKNIGFVIAFVGVLAARFLLRAELNVLGPETQSALFMTVAFGYLVPWRLVSFIKFRRLLGNRPVTTTPNAS